MSISRNAPGRSERLAFGYPATGGTAPPSLPAGDSRQAVAIAGRWLYSVDIRGSDSMHGSVAESGERGAQRGTQAQIPAFGG